MHVRGKRDMIKTTSSQHDEYRLAFLRHLPKRIETLEKRIQRFRQEGWEASGLSLLNDDVQRLAGASGRYDLVEASQHLLSVENMLGDFLARKTLPDPTQTDRLLALTASITASLAAHPEVYEHGGHSEKPPEKYWQRWVGDAPPPRAVAEIPTADAALASAPAAKAAPVVVATQRIYHLTDGDALSFELDQRFESTGYELELVETAEELIDLLTSLPPQLIVVGVSHSNALEAIGLTRRDVQKRTGSHIRLLVMAPHDDLPTRLLARRAGADVVLFPPLQAADVLKHVHDLLVPTIEDKVRVLIVEDDRAQALFAQSVLANAGMLAEVQPDPMRVLESLESFGPDLVLMDLHMPLANGVELTALIREHPEFMQTPIVFLSGESDPEARYDAIDAGGDDFLSKPISPKYLISAVQNRVRRVRAMQQRGPAPDARDDATGLYRRAYVLDLVNDALGNAAGNRSATGGVLFFDIDGIAALRERLGLASLELLLAETGRHLTSRLADRAPAARISDSGFLILATQLDDGALEALAHELRSTMMQHAFDAGGKSMRLRASVGICGLRHGFGDASSLLNTAERACREARANGRGVKRYEPPKAAEMAEESAMIELVRDAALHNGFELIYQPIVAVQGSQDAQYQTLLRLRDATGRVHAAGEIVPLAERAKLILDIDRWVLTRALSVLQQHRDSGRSLRLFVPQSTTTLATSDQAGWLKGELAAHEVPRGSLVLESRLEDALLYPQVLQTFARAMLDDGVQLCLGQFENSPEANSVLEQLPLGFIKLAHKYVSGPDTQALRDDLRSMIDRAHLLGMQVIGHRVEDAKAAATLWMSGIDYIQGNLVQGAAGALDFDFKAAVL
jgi:diguanylate cyclase (GGDEF)-like protein